MNADTYTCLDARFTLYSQFSSHVSITVLHKPNSLFHLNHGGLLRAALLVASHRVHNISRAARPIRTIIASSDNLQGEGNTKKCVKN